MFYSKQYSNFHVLFFFYVTVKDFFSGRETNTFRTIKVYNAQKIILTKYIILRPPLTVFALGREEPGTDDQHLVGSGMERSATHVETSGTK